MYQIRYEMNSKKNLRYVLTDWFNVSIEMIPSDILSGTSYYFF